MWFFLARAAPPGHHQNRAVFNSLQEQDKPIKAYTLGIQFCSFLHISTLCISGLVARQDMNYFLYTNRIFLQARISIFSEGVYGKGDNERAEQNKTGQNQLTGADPPLPLYWACALHCWSSSAGGYWYRRAILPGLVDLKRKCELM